MQASDKCGLSGYRPRQAAGRKWLSALGRCALLILLSDSVGASPRQCYWCGPLAEQVHRSQRVQPCGGGLATTTCDPGYDYCAVVATAPPRIESRYCVKLYQDECYPLFCNSTKTWRMTCPCRGDLCNGPNTEREIEAFAVLKKLAAKTNSRIKRSSKIDAEDMDISNDLVQTNKVNESMVVKNNNDNEIDTIIVTTNEKENDNIATETTTTIKSVEVNNNEPKQEEKQAEPPQINAATAEPIDNDKKTPKQDMQTDQNMHDIIAATTQPVDVNKSVPKQGMQSDQPVIEKKPEQPAREMQPDQLPQEMKPDQLAQEMQSDQPIQELKEPTSQPVEMNKSEPRQGMQADQPSKEIKAIETATTHSTSSKETTKDSIEGKDKKDNMKQNEIATTMKTEANVKPIAKMTSPESLEKKNNSDPKTTKMVQPTNATKVETTTTLTETTIAPTEPPKSSAVGIYLHFFLLVKWIIMYSCS